MSSVSPHRRQAFTLLELMTVMLLIAVLMVLIVPVVTQFKRRLEKTKCISNLRSLHVGMQAYVQDKHNWPQIPVQYGADDKATAQVWIATLKPYSLGPENWICPTIQYNLGSPNFHDEDNARIDYTPFPYGRNQQDPFRYANQPWFVERGDVHGNGNLLIFPDGHTEELVEFLRRVGVH